MLSLQPLSTRTFRPPFPYSSTHTYRVHDDMSKVYFAKFPRIFRAAIELKREFTLQDPGSWAFRRGERT